MASSCICTCSCVLTKLCLKAPQHLVLLLEQDVHQCAHEGASPRFRDPQLLHGLLEGSFLDGHGAEDDWYKTALPYRWEAVSNTLVILGASSTLIKILDQGDAGHGVA